MPVFMLDERHVFPRPGLANADGLLAVGGDLAPERVLLAYQQGIFPWYSDDQPILWFSPDPRFVLPTAALKVQRSLKKRVRRGDYEIRLDTAFAEVIDHCRDQQRPGQRGTWITQELRDSFIALHHRGFAHSAEAWQNGALVGGLYGVAIGGFFSGESMFALQPDASKAAFVWLSRQLEAWGFPLIDCQVYTEHLDRFGAVEVPRREYLAALREALRLPHRPGPWRFDEGFRPALPGDAEAP